MRYPSEQNESLVMDISRLFSALNQPIDEWDVISVTVMSSMFHLPLVQTFLLHTCAGAFVPGGGKDMVMSVKSSLHNKAGIFPMYSASAWMNATSSKIIAFSSPMHCRTSFAKT